MADIQEAPVVESTPAALPPEAPAVVTTTTEKAPSLDDTLAATMAEIKARRPEQGTDGKFIQKAGAPVATPEVEVPGQSQTGAPELVKPAIEAPQSLPADVRAKWDSFPPEAQQWLAKREGEIHEKITSDGQRLKNLEAFDEALAPAKSFIEQNRIPKPEYIRRLAAADEALRTNGPAALAEIARMYGINPGAAPQIGEAHQGQPDPMINALFQRQAALESKLTAQEKAEADAKLDQATKKVEAFKKDRPHFDKVEGLMTKLYEPGMELDTLYDMAVKAHPEVSKLIEADREAKAKAEAIEKQKRETAAAEKLQTFARKPGSVGVAAKAGQSWEDTMAAEHRKIKARG